MDRRIEGSRSGRTCLRWALVVLCGLLWAFAPQPITRAGVAPALVSIGRAGRPHLAPRGPSQTGICTPSASRASIAGMTRPSGERRGVSSSPKPSIASMMAAPPGSPSRTTCRPACLRRSRWTTWVATSSWSAQCSTPRLIDVLRSGAATTAASTGRRCPSLRCHPLRTASSFTRSRAARTAGTCSWVPPGGCVHRQLRLSQR